MFSEHDLKIWRLDDWTTESDFMNERDFDSGHGLMVGLWDGWARYCENPDCDFHPFSVETRDLLFVC